MSSIKMNSSGDFNLFEGIYEMRAAKVIGIAVSVFNLAVFAPMLAYAIFFEKFILDKRQKQSKNAFKVFEKYQLSIWKTQTFQASP